MAGGGLDKKVQHVEVSWYCMGVAVSLIELIFVLKP